MSDLAKKLRISFLAGLITVVPIAGSIIVLLWLFNSLTNVLLPRFVRDYLEQFPYPEFLFRLLALILCLALVTFAGWVTRLVIGKQLYAVMEGFIVHVPLLNKIYGFIKEVSQTMLAGKKTVFQRAVLVEYPRLGVFSIGFVTNENAGEAALRTNKQLINVFFPTTPNPTSGWLALVPREQLVDLDMSVAEAVKMVISGGTIVPSALPIANGRPTR